MLFGAVIFALLLGTAVSARGARPAVVSAQPSRHQGSSRHQMGLNPLWQGRSSLTQGFLCDWCVVGVEDVQAAIRENLDQIMDVLNRTSRLCTFCPAQEQCTDYFLKEIPLAIEEVLAQSPSDICSVAGLCNENATLPGMVMNNLNGHIARDRVIKRMLMRARIMQQKMIRLILGPDYLCTACQDFMTEAREMLLDNETQYMVVDFLAPLCDYMPTEFQTDCDEFVQSIPFLMTMIANEVLVASTCTELGFCNKTEKPEPELPDIFSQLGLPGILPVLGNGQNQNPFQFPTGNNRENPWGFPGQGRPNQNPFGLPNRPGQNPFGLPSRPGQNPFGLPSRPGQNPFGRPNRPGQSRPGQYPFGVPGQTRPRPQHPIGKWPTSTNTRPEKPLKPKPKPTSKPVNPIPDLNLEDIFGANTGVLDRLPEVPDMPNLRIPGLSINIPGSRRSDQSRRRQRGQGARRQRAVPDWKDIEKLIPKNEVHHEYIPDPIPDAGITITEQGADEDCEVCKLAVMAVDSWLQDNAPELQKMVSQLVQPVCQLFPSPMKEDCVSDVSEFVQTFTQILISKLQPESVCTWLTLCSDKEEVPLLPTMETPGAEPTTWPLFP